MFDRWFHHRFLGAATLCGLLAVLVPALALAGEPNAEGPDLITQVNTIFGLPACEQFGRQGTFGQGIVGLGLAPSACNNGSVPVHWFQLPAVDHPVMVMNMYRLANAHGSPRIEQIGQAWLKHGFGAAQFDECGLGCEAPFPNDTQLGVGCSDPYLASQSAQACNLSPRSSVHPYTGEYAGGAWLGPGGGCNSSGPSGNFPSKNHIGHVHNGISHLLQVQDIDLMPSLNAGATYFGEVQYITPHEYTAGNGNQNNNASHRELAVTGVSAGVFTFDEVGGAVSESPALDAWPGATQVLIEPQPGVDGRAFLAYEVTAVGAGTWHYEYAVYNMNLDQSVGAVSVPIGVGTTLSNIGFHAVLNHAPELHADNYSNDPWTVTTSPVLRWATTPFDEDPLANAVRYGTLYNFRFDADAPPGSAPVTVELFKPGPSAQVVVTAVAPISLCETLADCADLDADGIRDDPCTWWACTASGCEGVGTVFADLGGEFGACTADLVADAHDRFHALSCFANTDTLGVPPYPCEPDSPQAYNVDAGGEFGSCSPDGICDGHDAFHALNAFSGLSSCSCPASGSAPGMKLDPDPASRNNHGPVRRR